MQVLVCQSDMDITIKVSDQGGGVDRVTAEKMFQYLYTTSPSPSLTAESVPLSGFGYGLPLSRLYARCSICPSTLTSFLPGTSRVTSRQPHMRTMELTSIFMSRHLPKNL